MPPSVLRTTNMRFENRSYVVIKETYQSTLCSQPAEGLRGLIIWVTTASASMRVVGVGWVKGGSIAWLVIECIRMNTGSKSKIRLTIYRKIGGQISTRAFDPAGMLHTQVPSAACSVELSTIKSRAKRPKGAWSSPRRLSYPAFGQCDRYCINQKIPQSSLENGRSIPCLYFKMTWKSRESVDTEQGIGISGEGLGAEWRVGGRNKK